MNTQFNLVGWFARRTRSRIDGPVTEHPQQAITLASHISADMASTMTPGYWENMADQHAVAHAKYSPYEKMWMVDWQLVPIENQEIKAA